jgi:hypothetical protein
MPPSSHRPIQSESAHETPAQLSSPKVGGDELFVPASHVLVIDRQVSHPAFRLWCILHRLWFLHEPPTMELLQELMGTLIANKASPKQKTWQPATRRSVERWLTELEQAGWLFWVRREEATRRYHLRTSARSATDSAIIRELRALLNSGKTTLAHVQALLNTTPELPVDATPESHGAIGGSPSDAPAARAGAGDATAGSYPVPTTRNDATAESHDTTSGSYDTTPESHHATVGSHDTTTESHDATPGSHHAPGEGVLMRRNNAPYNETLQNQIREDPTPPPAPASPTGGDGGGATDTERFLLRQGFSFPAAREFRALDLGAVQADLERRRSLGQGIGAIVTTWRVEPPRVPTPVAHTTTRHTAAQAKEQALALAPADTTELEIQYLALDLEDGATSEVALANHRRRREATLVGDFR